MRSRVRRDSVSTSWDNEYRLGRYASDPPLPFARDITTTLQARPLIQAGKGLYVGCGNGRNFVSLHSAGLNLVGIDSSPEAIAQLRSKLPPDADDRLLCVDFVNFSSPHDFDYLIAIQVFQHGTESEAYAYFEKVQRLLRTRGLFFLRVNSVSTKIERRHEVLSQNPQGGLTIRYQEGPKDGLPIHFFSRQELEVLTHDGFGPALALWEVATLREQPQSGTWVQWEGIWERGAGRPTQ